MNWRNKLGLKTTETAPSHLNQEALKKIGMQLISFDRVGQRQNELKLFNQIKDKKVPQDKTTPEEIFEWHVEQWNNLWDMYKDTQLMWFKAGSRGIFGKIVNALEEIKEEIEVAIEANRYELNRYTEQSKIASTNSDTQKRITAKKMQVVRDFHIAYLVKLGYKYVGKVGNLCWFAEDILIPEAFTIMTNQTIQPGRVDLAGTNIQSEQQQQPNRKKHERV